MNRWHIVDLIVGLVIGFLASTAFNAVTLGVALARQDERLTSVIAQVQELTNAVKRLERRDQ